MPRSVALNRSLTHHTGGRLSLSVPTFVLVGRNGQGKHILRRDLLQIDIDPLVQAANQPLISCLLVTQDRTDIAQISVDCFRRQTWKRKELVVIDTSRDDRLVKWLGSLGDSSIKILHLPGCTDTLGDLRNLSVEQATGDFVCQWDDDDLQHPCRLEIAAKAMAATGTRASMLLREVFWLTWRQAFAFTSRRPWEGTILAGKEVLPRYPSWRRGEDWPVINQLVGSTPVALLDVPELYVYVAHGLNTWDSGHMGEIWNGASVQFEPSRYNAIFAELSQSLPLMPYLKATRAMAARKQ